MENSLIPALGLASWPLALPALVLTFLIRLLFVNTVPVALPPCSVAPRWRSANPKPVRQRQRLGDFVSSRLPSPTLLFMRVLLGRSSTRDDSRGVGLARHANR
jgi:hypothetical protein